jgi:hypothetical protein
LCQRKNPQKTAHFGDIKHILSITAPGSVLAALSGAAPLHIEGRKKRGGAPTRELARPSAQIK